eukprot:TRINITY_DN4438_c1_g1_i1.p1 TRINITY_DN4438_c1_g1~~TRINITY_DN4438_c1_g1_i1.p1  ORF type:complete len:378 (-),score=80.41 TRINITY_DN4438_c1_g1_i1:26-1078(-)
MMVRLASRGQEYSLGQQQRVYASASRPFAATAAHSSTAFPSTAHSHPLVITPPTAEQQQSLSANQHTTTTTTTVTTTTTTHNPKPRTPFSSNSHTSAFHSRATNLFSPRHYTATTTNTGLPARVLPDAPHPQAAEVDTVELKSQIAQLVDKQLNDSKPYRQFCEDYLARTGFELHHDQGRITLSKLQGRQMTKVTFQAKSNWDSDTDTEDDNADENEIATTGSAELESMDDPVFIEDNSPDTPETRREFEIKVIVQIILLDKTNEELSRLSLTCWAQQNSWTIESMHSADGSAQLEFFEVSDQLQNKLYEFLESMHIGTQLGQFVTEYSYYYDQHKSVPVLNDLKAVLLF